MKPVTDADMARHWDSMQRPDDPADWDDCSDCAETITGASWSGRCYDCHLAAMLPPDSFYDEYLAPLDIAGGAES